MKYIFLSLFLMLGPAVQAVFGWGQTGHRVIGLIAEQHLSKKAKKNIESILGCESLAYASNYMDEIKSDDRFDHTHDWHWVTINEGNTYHQCEKNPKGDLLEAIGRMRNILESDTASAERKKESLRFLVHLVGDLHQPLHVGKGDDKGGNDVKLKWFGKNSNLHRVWDSDMIESKELSYTELAGFLCVPDKLKIAEIQSGTAEDWAHEAMQYRARVYETGGEKLGYEYMYKNWSLVEEQLVKGGLRLAGMLNEIFG